MTTRDELTRASKECTPTVIRVEPMLHLECSLPHIALRQGPACTSLLERLCPTAAPEESLPQLQRNPESHAATQKAPQVPR